MKFDAATEELEQLLRADPHQWGPGTVHQIHSDRDQTLCGKRLRACPGENFTGFAAEITCKVCLRVRETAARDAEWEKKLAEERAKLAEHRANNNRGNYTERERKWREAYVRYLSSGEWFAKRAKVLRRADGVCEGCGYRTAVQVHHLRYPRNCQPGSDEWVRQEKLFDLRAICRECHEDVHQR